MNASENTKPVRQQLLQLASQMDEAIHTKQIDRLRKLMSQRRTLLETIFTQPEYADVAPHIANEALTEDHRWLGTFSDMRDGIREKMDQLQRQRLALRNLGGAYDPYSTRRSLVSTQC